MAYYKRELAGKQKGIKRVLKERGLWPERGLISHHLARDKIDRAAILTSKGGCIAPSSCSRKGFPRSDWTLGTPSPFYQEFHRELKFIELVQERTASVIMNL